jgi:colanic acid biosynthesis glycosyl transferase WcaI
MKILILTQWFDPEPTFKGVVFAKALVALGHEVNVLTGFPNYPSGKLYDGYSIKFMQKEKLDGIDVLRVPLYPSHDRSAIRRMTNYISFALSATFIGGALSRGADVAYVYNSPATIGFPAIALRILRGIPFVYDIQDLWPDSLQSTGMFSNRHGLAIVGYWCQVIYSLASRITVISKGFRNILIERGVPSSKISVIYNWCDEDFMRPLPRDEILARDLNLTGRFNVMFAGNMGPAQALSAVVKAAEMLSGSHPHVQFVFVGDGVETQYLKQMARDIGLKNVLFIQRKPYSEIGAILNLADVLLVHLKDDPLFEITLPSKTQSCLSVGKPILMAVRGEAAQMVREAGAGLCCTPEDPSSIADAVATFASMSSQELEQMGRKGKSYYDAEMSLATGVKRFEDIFLTLVKDCNPSPGGVHTL